MIRADAPLETVPMFVRGGAVIPLGPEMNYTNEKPLDPLSFMIYADEKGQAQTTLYEDDGSSPAYRQGVFRRTSVSVSAANGGFQIDTGAPEGTYNPGGLGATTSTAQGNGWYGEGDRLSVRITDDGKAHRIQIR
jgi:alpha-glucosidase (family GH31 glycosyl hydrolase)